MPIAVGETFERYEIESLIGRGGMGEVYRAVDTRLRRKVALKVLRPDRGSEDAVARLFREARAAAVLAHPNTVAIHDIGESEGIFYIVMELVTGSPLLAYVGDARVPAARKLGWLVDIARALSAAHKSGVVHRDVKPSNVMVSDEGVVKVLDFGLARPLAPLSFRTQAGQVLGTPRYMAPEQLAGADVDARCDQYAFGLTAYELVAGKHPGGALTTTVAPPLDDVVPEVSRAVARVVARAMATDPAERYPSMEEVAVALEDAAAGRRDRNVAPEAPEAPEAPDTTAPVNDTVRFTDVGAPGSAVLTERVGGGEGVIAAIDILQAMAEPVVRSASAPATARDLEEERATLTVRTLAAAQETHAEAEAAAAAATGGPRAGEAPVPEAPARTVAEAVANVSAPPTLHAKTLMSPRDIAGLGPPVLKATLRAAGNLPAIELVAPGRGPSQPPSPLREALEKTTPRSPPAGSPAARKSRLPLLVVALVVLGVSAFAGTYFGTKKLPPTDGAAPSSSLPSASASTAAPASLPTAVPTVVPLGTASSERASASVTAPAGTPTPGPRRRPATPRPSASASPPALPPLAPAPAPAQKDIGDPSFSAGPQNIR